MKAVLQKPCKKGFCKMSFMKIEFAKPTTLQIYLHLFDIHLLMMVYLIGEKNG